MADAFLVGVGEATVAATPAVAFAFLSDPRNAGEWFAGSGFAEAPTGSPRAGMSWRFERMRGTRGHVPVSMTVYEPPSRFIWETRLGVFSTNNVWELRCEPATVESDEADQPAKPGTLITMTIRLRPRLFGWLGVVPALPLLRGQLPSRAQRAAARAAEAVQAHAQSSARRRSQPPPRNPRRERGRGKRR